MKPKVNLPSTMTNIARDGSGRGVPSMKSKLIEALRFLGLCLFLLYFTATVVLFIVSLVDLWRH